MVVDLCEVVANSVKLQCANAVVDLGVGGGWGGGGGGGGWEVRTPPPPPPPPQLWNLK